MSLDLTKPVQTRSGHKVEILKTDLRVENEFRLAGVIDYESHEQVATWTEDGRYSTFGGGHALDLVQVPETVTLWLNVYRHGPWSPCWGYAYASEDIAKNCTDKHGLAATIPVEITLPAKGTP